MDLNGVNWVPFESLPYSSKQSSLLGKNADAVLFMYYVWQVSSKLRSTLIAERRRTYML